ncbi:uncharacterized protein LOC113328880 [Papaver somniferum]|uniref:uncharacterized protein LOC113328880 n=1 Tax=Papaver somniferum TaxID=3469 RepID=UPI000E6F68E7|nr:uncharacterized protein LOC113328880 [Papaver somniferum]
MYTMSLLQWKSSNVVMCKFFLTSLDGDTRGWFYGLPPGSIGSYDTLVETFLENYMHNSKARPRVNRLFTLARRFREPLRTLTERWKKLCTEIGKVSVDQQIFGFENALGKSYSIWIAMFSENPQTLKQMRRMQEHYIALEGIHEESKYRGVQEISAADRVTTSEAPRRTEKRPDPPPRGAGKKEWVEKGKIPRHEAKEYTPLNVPLEEIFKQVEKRNDIIYLASRGVQFEETKDHPEYCHYHQHRGHSTNNCRGVKDIVHHLIRDGYLRQFIRHSTPTIVTSDAPVHQVRIDRSTKFLCNTISHLATQGYDLGSGITSRIHKRDRNVKEIFSMAKTLPMEPWMMQPNSFSAKDLPMNGQAHGDPLVITLMIEKWGVRRILVDSGSSVEGEVTLRVSDGGGYLDTLTTFCVVDVVSPYEAIIGRPWIAGIKGVASAYHRRLRFPTCKGVVEVIGNSQEDRQCMQVDIQQNEERRARQRREKNKAKEEEAAQELEKVISQAVMGYEPNGRGDL